MEEKERIKKLEEEISVLRSHLRTDELTQVLNRRGIKEEFGALFREAKYSRDHTHRRAVAFEDITILFFDLDNFKELNDTYGHETGDRALSQTAHILARNIRGIDRIGRYGGEEFVVALPGAGEDDGEEKAHALNKKLGEMKLGDKIPFRVTASVGVASLGETDVENVSELIKKADKAMYEAKTNRGKNTVVIYSELADE